MGGKRLVSPQFAAIVRRKNNPPEKGAHIMSDTSNDVIQGQALYRVQLAAGIEDLTATVRECRSYRRFDEGTPIPRDLMLALVDLGAAGASAGNHQPLRYHVVKARSPSLTRSSRACRGRPTSRTGTAQP